MCKTKCRALPGLTTGYCDPQLILPTEQSWPGEVSWQTYLAAVCRDDSEISRNPVPTFHLHQVPDYDIFCVDAHFLAISNYKCLLWKGRQLTPLDGSQQGKGEVQNKKTKLQVSLSHVTRVYSSDTTVHYTKRCSYNSIPTRDCLDNITSYSEHLNFTSVYVARAVNLSERKDKEAGT